MTIQGKPPGPLTVTFVDARGAAAPKYVRVHDRVLCINQNTWISELKTPLIRQKAFRMLASENRRELTLFRRFDKKKKTDFLTTADEMEAEDKKILLSDAARTVREDLVDNERTFQHAVKLRSKEYSHIGFIPVEEEEDAGPLLQFEDQQIKKETRPDYPTAAEQLEMGVRGDAGRPEDVEEMIEEEYEELEEVLTEVSDEDLKELVERFQDQSVVLMMERVAEKEVGPKALEQGYCFPVTFRKGEEFGLSIQGTPPAPLFVSGIVAGGMGERRGICVSDRLVAINGEEHEISKLHGAAGRQYAFTALRARPVELIFFRFGQRPDFSSWKKPVKVERMIKKTRMIGKHEAGHTGPG